MKQEQLNNIYKCGDKCFFYLNRNALDKCINSSNKDIEHNIIENNRKFNLADETVSSAKLKDFSAAVDLNTVELVLDADADTSITADTDDRIDFKIANKLNTFLSNSSSGDTVIKPMVDAKDIKFQQFDGRTLLDINDGGFVGIANGATSSGEIRFLKIQIMVQTM